MAPWPVPVSDAVKMPGDAAAPATVIAAPAAPLFNAVTCTSAAPAISQGTCALICVGDAYRMPAGVPLNKISSPTPPQAATPRFSPSTVTNPPGETGPETFVAALTRPACEITGLVEKPLNTREAGPGGSKPEG